jgi:hypothetical protein
VFGFPMQIPDFQFILNHTGFVIVIDVEKLPSDEKKNMNQIYREEVLYKNFMEFFDTFWVPRNLSEFLTWSFKGLPQRCANHVIRLS